MQVHRKVCNENERNQDYKNFCGGKLRKAVLENWHN